MGFVTSEYIWTHLPEPGARLHRVESGVPGTALAITETYYGELATQWGQDLRFFVNVLAHANRLPVPPGTTGWRQVHFRHDTLIWIPSRRYAQSLSDVVNSGSFSHNLATTMGSTAARVMRLCDDFHRAIALSTRYLGEAVTRHAERVLRDVVMAVAEMVLGTGSCRRFRDRPHHPRMVGTRHVAELGRRVPLEGRPGVPPIHQHRVECARQRDRRRSRRSRVRRGHCNPDQRHHGGVAHAGDVSRGILDGESAPRNGPCSQDRRISVGGMAQPSH